MKASRHTVLVVEGSSAEKLKGSGLASNLREAGYDVLVTRSAYEAIGLVFVNRRIDAVVVVNSCVPMSPSELAVRLRSINPRIIVLLTGSRASGSQSTPDDDAPVVALVETLENYWQMRKPVQSTSARSESSKPEYIVVAG